MDNTFLLFKSPSLWCFAVAAPGNKYTPWQRNPITLWFSCQSSLASEVTLTHGHGGQSLSHLKGLSGLTWDVQYCQLRWWKRIWHYHSFSRVQLFAMLWTVALQAPLSLGFSRHKYWNGLPCPPPGDLPDPGTEPVSLLSPALAGGFFTTSTTWEAHNILSFHPKSHFCVYFIMYKLLV